MLTIWTASNFQNYGTGVWTAASGAPRNVQWSVITSDSSGKYVAATVAYGLLYTNQVKLALSLFMSIA
jgi:hypothetical protein